VVGLGEAVLDAVLVADPVEDVAAEDGLDLGMTARFLGRSAKAMPLSVSTVWIAYGKAATTSRRKAAPFALVFGVEKATWVNSDTRSMAKEHEELALGQAQLADVDVDVADPGLGETSALEALSSPCGRREMPCRCRQRCRALRDSRGIVSRRQPRTSSSGAGCGAGTRRRSPPRPR
jgi:hypothetical protein